MSVAFQKIVEALNEARTIVDNKETYVVSRLSFVIMSYIENNHEKIIWNIHNMIKHGVTHEVVFRFVNEMSPTEVYVFPQSVHVLEKHIFDNTGIPFKIKVENNKYITLLLNLGEKT